MKLILRCAVLISFLMLPFISRAQADLGVIVTGPLTVINDNNLATTIAVLNNGPQAATGVTLNIGINLHTKFVSLTPPPGWSFTITGGPNSPATVTATIDSISPGVVVLFTLVTKAALPTGAYAAGYISADVSSSTPDPKPDDNAASRWYSISLGADTAGPEANARSLTYVYIGTSIVYIIQVTNPSSEPYTNITLTDTLGAGLTFTSLTAPDGWTINTPAVGSGGAVSAFVPTLAPGAVANFVLTGELAGPYPYFTPLANNSTITGLNSKLENYQKTIFNIYARPVSSPYPELAIIQNGPATAKPGNLLTYTINIKNIGLDTLHDVTWRDTLPPGVSLIVLGLDADPLRWKLKSFSVGNLVIIEGSSDRVPGNSDNFFEFKVRLAGNYSGKTLVNTVSATSSSWELNTRNNSSTTTATIEDTQPPVIATCPALPALCYSNNNNYTIPKLIATDNVGVKAIQYSITGATTRSGEGDDASGTI